MWRYVLLDEKSIDKANHFDKCSLIIKYGILIPICQELTSHE